MDDLISREEILKLPQRKGYAINGYESYIRVYDIEHLPSAQTKSEERTAESEQNVPNGELISKKSAIESFLADGMITAAIYVSRMPSVHPTIFGYDLKQLILIAEILKKENLTPEKVFDALTDIEHIINIVRDEFEETLRESMNQFKI